MSATLANAHRIAIVRLSALGDVVNTLPALTALRRALPAAHVAWICEAASAGVLADHPLLDELIVVDRKGWERALCRLYGLLTVPLGFVAFAHRLRRARFDAAIDFQGNLRSGVVAFLTRAPLRIGLAAGGGKEGSHRFVHHRVALPERPMHRVERALWLLRAVGIETADAEPVVPVTDADRQRVDQFLAACGLAAGPFAVIHPGTSRFGRYKQWPGERWAAVARRLACELGLRVALTHGPGRDETEEAEAIAQAAGAVVAPRLSLRELGEVLRRARLVLSVDTGPMHLASAVGAPVVALFGPKDPALHGPHFGPRAIVAKELDCRPCRRRWCDDPQCMAAITPDDVLAAARQLANTTGRRL